MLSTVSCDHLHVGAVGPVHGHAHREATALDQQTALDALLGAVGGVFARLFPPRGVPWSYTRPYSARPSRCLATRRRPTGRPPRVLGRHRPRPIPGSGRGRWSRGRSGWRPGPSTGSRCVGRRGWPPYRPDRRCGAGRRRSGGCLGVRGAGVSCPPRCRPGCSSRRGWCGLPWVYLQKCVSCSERQVQLHLEVVAFHGLFG